MEPEREEKGARLRNVQGGYVCAVHVKVHSIRETIAKPRLERGHKVPRCPHKAAEIVSVIVGRANSSVAAKSLVGLQPPAGLSPPRPPPAQLRPVSSSHPPTCSQPFSEPVST